VYWYHISHFHFLWDVVSLYILFINFVINDITFLPPYFIDHKCPSPDALRFLIFPIFICTSVSQTCSPVSSFSFHFALIHFFLRWVVCCKSCTNLTL
jgi:hypothetical protein